MLSERSIATATDAAGFHLGLTLVNLAVPATIKQARASQQSREERLAGKVSERETFSTARNERGGRIKECWRRSRLPSFSHARIGGSARRDKSQRCAKTLSDADSIFAFWTSV